MTRNELLDHIRDLLLADPHVANHVTDPDPIEEQENLKELLIAVAAQL